MMGRMKECTLPSTPKYAMVARDDDVKLGIHSSALFFGKYDVIAVMACYAFALLLLAVAGLMVAEGIALYHYRLIKDRSREKCFKAFLHNNWLGAVVFAGVVGNFWLRA